MIPHIKGNGQKPVPLDRLFMVLFLNWAFWLHNSVQRMGMLYSAICYNYTQIEVTVQSNDGFQGTVMLWNTENSNSFIQIHDVNEKAASCTFTGLSSSNRYQITCDNLDGMKITVSEGRTISFWHSLRSVLRDIIGTIGR